MKKWFLGLNKWIRWSILAILIIFSIYLIKIFIFPSQEDSAYITTNPTVMNLENTVMATGITNAYKQVSVGAQVSGQIQELQVAVGQKVKKGDILAVIDAQTQQNTYLSAKAEMASNQAALIKAKLDFDRQSQMLPSGATSKAEYDSAKASLALAKAQLDQSRLKVETSRVSLGYTKVVAPIDGVVISIAVEQGQTVNANQSTPTILVLAQIDKIIIKSEISEADVQKLKVGMDATFTTLGNNTKEYKTKISSIDPAPTTITNVSSTNLNSTADSAIYYYATMEMPNDDNQLKIGMTTQIKIISNSIKNALTIPAVALGEKNSNGLYGVKVLNKNNEVETKYIKTGLNNGIDVEVKSGLSKNDDVIISEKSSSNTSSTTNSKISARRMPPGGM
ncbi:MAG: efflux RND transporter periplasmic adaptor subunit [Sulfurovaceae bacterium]|nr:efflux RND transporter periplasmic adaptor subunit [Sulfurovaceae bacterium]